MWYCGICNADGRDNYIDHLFQHMHNRPNLECLGCGVQHESGVDLAKHIQEVHIYLALKCDFCGVQIVDGVYAMQQHLIVHCTAGCSSHE